MRRWVVCLLVTLGALGIRTGSAHASWVSDHCDDDDRLVDPISREAARAYGEVAAGEGYEWGGGCWNSNDRDDTPPGSSEDTGGEGPDCSGLAFKAWHLRSTAGADGFRWYSQWENIHGPYTSSDFHSPLDTWPFHKLANKNRSTTQFMDAFAKEGHVGLLDTSDNPSKNTDWILEAVGYDLKTGIYEESYRSQSEYVGVVRENWETAPPCDVHCGTVDGRRYSIRVVP
jgi:hypothetical protein